MPGRENCRKSSYNCRGFMRTENLGPQFKLLGQVELVKFGILVQGKIILRQNIQI